MRADGVQRSPTQCESDSGGDVTECARTDMRRPLSEVELPVKPCIVTTRAQKVKGALQELPFFEEDWELGSIKPSKPKAQRRREKVLGTLRKEAEGPGILWYTRL